MKSIRIAAILITLIFGKIGCITAPASQMRKSVKLRKISPHSVDPKHDIVTVWVHGTGRNPLIRKFHTSPKGLLSWSKLPKEYGLKNVGLALHQHDAFQFHIEDFYTFGWSGLLSYEARQEAGIDLKSALLSLRSVYKDEHKQSPKIRLIAHSHGCNVALNMVREIGAEESLEIEELVLLACPVQEATKKMVESKRLKTIFAFYSNKDLTQILDPQGLYVEGKKHNAPFFSERTFPKQHNLIQAEIKWKGVGLTHAGFVRERFGKALPNLLATLREHKQANGLTTPIDQFVIDISG